MNLYVTLPVLIPLTSAAAGLLAWRREEWQRRIGVAGAVALAAASVALLGRVLRHGVQVESLGGWRAPMGITLVADTLGALMVLITGIVALAVLFYAAFDVDRRRQGLGLFPMLHVLLAGVCGSFLTGDLFNLYVWFEVMLIAGFVLLALGGGRAQLEGAFKYVALNLLGSVVFLIAVGLIYGSAGTLDMADLAGRMEELHARDPWWVVALATMLAFSFGVKAGVFPLYSWLPASYPVPPIAVTAIFAGLLTKVGIYAMLRVFTLVFPPLPGLFRVLLVAGAATMLVGVLGAVARTEVKRILSFHIVSQIGYMVVGLGLLSAPDPATRRLAAAATIFYVLHHILVKTNLFLIGGVMRRIGGGLQLDRLGGLARTAPLLAVLFLVPALSLAGIPPLSGFWAKLAILRAGLEAREYAVVAVALLAGLLTLVSMAKIWTEAFWGPAPEPGDDHGRHVAPLLAPVLLLAVLTLGIGLAPGWLFGLAQEAADGLLGVESSASAFPGDAP